MAGPIVVDAHMHVYETKAEGERQKAGYEIWEYGAKPGVPFSRYAGDVDDVMAAMRQAGYAHAVSVNMFAPALAREEAAFEGFRARIAGLDEALLGLELGNGDTVAEVIVYDGPRHYDEHTAHLRAWFGTDADDGE